jgi:hypothetical protein
MGISVMARIVWFPGVMPRLVFVSLADGKCQSLDILRIEFCAQEPPSAGPFWDSRWPVPLALHLRGRLEMWAAVARRAVDEGSRSPLTRFSFEMCPVGGRSR